jgi:hypothetical protein
MPLSYATAGLQRGASNSDLVRILQRDLRALGYLRQGIDGEFQGGTDLAVRRLQHDLLHNAGRSTANDGDAPVAISAYNQNRVTNETGRVDQGLAACIDALLSDPKVPKLPSAADAVAANRAARAAIAAGCSTLAPAPFLLAIFMQESNGRQFCEPTAHDSDNFVMLGLDARPETPCTVTSRGYGIGQYTLFHHPPRSEEIASFIEDPLRNVEQAFVTLRAKFDGELCGGTPGTMADDRAAEHPSLALRRCRYRPGDARYLRDCRACALAAGKRDLTPDTPVYSGAAQRYGEAPHYAPTTYYDVPQRAAFLCDWPYAVRRYNGSGCDSYNYQARVLRNLLTIQPPAGAAGISKKGSSCGH